MLELDHLGLEDRLELRPELRHLHADDGSEQLEAVGDVEHEVLAVLREGLVVHEQRCPPDDRVESTARDDRLASVLDQPLAGDGVRRRVDDGIRQPERELPADGGLLGHSGDLVGEAVAVDEDVVGEDGRGRGERRNAAQDDEHDRQPVSEARAHAGTGSTRNSLASISSGIVTNRIPSAFHRVRIRSVASIEALRS